jgi:hypothetical protein
MSKGTRVAFAAITLAVLAACAPRHEEVVVVEPAPQPIYVEPQTGKYH